MRRWAARLLEAIFWWGACLGVWLVSLSAVSGQELLVATLASLPCAALAVYGRIVARHAWRVRPAWLVPALLLPLTIVTDSAQVLASAVTRRPGRFDTIPVAGGRGSGSLPEGRRAVASWLVTVTPGSYVVDIDPDDGTALVHVLAERGPSMQDVATR